MGEEDVVIVGGGPAGLQAALMLGRAGRQVTLVDDRAPARNAAAKHIQNFVTRDGTEPEAFRIRAREQLQKYPTVSILRGRVITLSATSDRIVATLESARIRSKFAMLATGMVDEMLNLEGFREAWGESIFQCPYCHGWEVRSQRWGYVATDDFAIEHRFVEKLLNWTDDVALFTAPGFTLRDEHRKRLEASPVTVYTSPVVRLHSTGGRLTGVELEDGRIIDCSILYAHPKQRQTALLESLSLELDANNYVVRDPMTLRTSQDRIYVAGDAVTPMQSALGAASSGAQTAAAIVRRLTEERLAV